MRITIIPDDSFVSVDNNSSHQPLDISQCGVPADVHALQWFDTRGWIEFKDGDPFEEKPANMEIDTLPAWANNCVTAWENWTPPVPNAPDVGQNQPTTYGTQTV